jgi:hypothetical protein
MAKSRKNQKSSRKNNETNRKLKALRAQAGVDRAEFFANGGDVKQWRGSATVTVDKRKQRNKKACRGKRWRK